MMNKLYKKKSTGKVELTKARPSVYEKGNKKKKVDETVTIPYANVSNASASAGSGTKAKSSESVNTRSTNARLLLTRRNLLFGALGVGILAAGGAGVKLVSDNMQSDTDTTDSLQVPKENVVTSDTFQEVNTLPINVSQEITMPLGTLAWANNDDIIITLVPSETAKPLVSVVAINANSLDQTTVISNAVGQAKGFEIFDVRANNRGIIWTEANVLQGEWKIYASSWNANLHVDPILVDTGDSDFETPTIAISDNYIYWQVMPSQDGTKTKESSVVKQLRLSALNDEPNVVLTSKGRMCSPLYSCNDGFVATPRTSTTYVIHNLTFVDNSGKVTDEITLPQGMKPLEAGYGQTGFMFSFDSIYNYGDGISNLGTYTPLVKTSSYSDANWLSFNRTPTAPPCWCNNMFIIRSSMSVCALDLSTNSYKVLDRPNASDDYGDYLASSGNCSRIVTYANISDTPVTGDTQKYCLIRIWG